MAQGPRYTAGRRGDPGAKRAALQAQRPGCESAVQERGAS
jgi:hypothetical protein